jgi:NitT/TauT family transport system permease protein
MFAQLTPARIGRLVWGIGLPLVIVGAWQAAPSLFSIPPYILPTPLEVARDGVHDHRQLLGAASSTGLSALTGFAIGNTVGIATAAIIAASQTAYRIILPIALVVRSIPMIALSPFLTLLMGRGIVTVTTIAVLIVFFPTTVNGLLGLRSVDPQIIDFMRVTNATRWDVFRRVAFPTALPSIFAAMKIAAPSSVLGVMVAEWIASDRGLGAVILASLPTFETGVMWSAIVISVAIAACGFGLVAYAERRLIPWHQMTV